jgi:hypothetical protein
VRFGLLNVEKFNVALLVNPGLVGRDPVVDPGKIHNTAFSPKTLIDLFSGNRLKEKKQKERKKTKES